MTGPSHVRAVRVDSRFALEVREVVGDAPAVLERQVAADEVVLRLPYVPTQRPSSAVAQTEPGFGKRYAELGPDPARYDLGPVFALFEMLVDGGVLVEPVRCLLATT